MTDNTISKMPRPYSLILGGEALHSRDITPWQQHHPNLRLINEYGPTEAVVGCCIPPTTSPLDFSGDTVPHRSPPSPTSKSLRPRSQPGTPPPSASPAKLYIGGAGVARGYLNRPDLTAERFVPNPFFQGTGNGEQGNREWGTGNFPYSLLPTPYSPTPFFTRLVIAPATVPTAPSNTWAAWTTRVKLRGYRIEPGEIEGRPGPASAGGAGGCGAAG